MPIKLITIINPVKIKIIFNFTKKKETVINDEDDFEDWGEDDADDKKYWFTKDKIDKISLVHNYLDSLPEIGKVISFSSIIDENDKTLPT